MFVKENIPENNYGLVKYMLIIDCMKCLIIENYNVDVTSFVIICNKACVSETYAAILTF